MFFSPRRYLDGGGAAALDLHVAIAEGNLPTTAANQDFTKSTFGGGTPKLAITTMSEETTRGSNDDILSVSLGAYDGTSQWSVSGCANHGQGASEVWRRAATDEVCQWLLENSGAIDQECNADSFITNGVRLTGGTTSASTPLLTALLLGGSAVENVDVGTVTLSTQDTAVSVNTGFEPDLVILCGHGQPFNDTVNSFFWFSCGFCHNDGLGGITQVGMSMTEGDADDPTENAGAVFSNRVGGAVSVATGSIARTVELSNFSGSGFDATSRGGNGSNDTYGYIAIKFSAEVNVWVGNIDTATSMGETTHADPNFRPKLMGLLPTVHSAVDTGALDGKGGTFGISWITENERAAFLYHSEDNTSTSNTASGIGSNDRAIHVRAPADTANMYAADFVEFTSSGPRFNYLVANATARKMPAFAIG